MISLSFANFSFAQINIIQKEFKAHNVIIKEAIEARNKVIIEAQKKTIIDATKIYDNFALNYPKNQRIWIQRAIAYLDLASFPDPTVSLIDANAPFKALDFISEAIKLETKDGIKGGYAKEAENLFFGIIMLKAHKAFMNLAVTKYNNRDYLNANKYIKKAYEFAPNDTLTANWKGVIALWCNDYTEAKDAFESYSSNGGNDISVLLWLSKFYFLEKNEFKLNEIKIKAIAIYGVDNWLKQEKNSNAITEKIETAFVEKENQIQVDIKKEVSKEASKDDTLSINLKPNISSSVETFTIDNKPINFKTNNGKNKTLIPFKNKNGFYNILNPQTNQIDNSNYDEIIPSYFNYLKVRKDKLWGLVNTKGEIIVPVKYDLILDANENYISATNKKVGDFGITSIINRNGLNLKTNKHYFLRLEYDESLGEYLIIEKNIILNLVEGEGFTIFNQDEKIIKTIKPGNDFLTRFNEFNNALVYNKGIIKLIDSNNNVLFEYPHQNAYGRDPYFDIEYVGEGLYKLKDESGLFALIDKSGNRLTPFKFRIFRKFKNNRALVVTENNFTEFIDKQGKTRIKLGNQLSESEIKDFENNFSVNKISVIDTLGNKINLPNLGNGQDILINTFFSNHFNFRNQNNKYGIISTNGKIIVFPRYDSISDFKYGFAIVEINNKYGVINDLGVEILKVKYDKIYTLHKNQLGNLKYEAEDLEKGEFFVFNGLVKVEVSGDEFFVDTLGNEFYEK